MVFADAQSIASPGLTRLRQRPSELPLVLALILAPRSPLLIGVAGAWHQQHAWGCQLGLQASPPGLVAAGGAVVGPLLAFILVVSA